MPFLDGNGLGHARCIAAYCLEEDGTGGNADCRYDGQGDKVPRSAFCRDRFGVNDPMSDRRCQPSAHNLDSTQTSPTLLVMQVSGTRIRTEFRPPYLLQEYNRHSMSVENQDAAIKKDHFRYRLNIWRDFW